MPGPGWGSVRVCVSVAARINGVVMMWTHHRAGTASLQILPEKHIQPRKELQAYRQEGSRLHNSDSSGMGTKRQKRKDWHDPREHPFVSRPLITQQAALHAAAPHRREKRCPKRYSPLMQNIFYVSPFQNLAASLSRLPAHASATPYEGCPGRDPRTASTCSASESGT